MPFRFLKRREMTAARFAGFGILAPTMVKPQRRGSAFVCVCLLLQDL